MSTSINNLVQMGGLECHRYDDGEGVGDVGTGT